MASENRAEAKQRLLSYLEANGIKYENLDHPVVLTVEEQAKYVSHLPGGVSKNLLLKDKKDRLFLISALTSTKIDLKLLSFRLGLGKGGLRMAPEDLMQATLQVPLGCVTPFALLNTTASAVVLLLDAGFRHQPQLYFHPLTNDCTTGVAPAGLDAFLQALGREPAYVDLEANPTINKDNPPDLASLVPPSVKGEAGAAPGGGAAAEVKAAAVGGGAAPSAVSMASPVRAGGLSSAAAPSSSSKSKNKQPTPAKAAVAGPRADDVQETASSILRMAMDLVHKELSAAGAQPQGDGAGAEDAVVSLSRAMKAQLTPELENMLMTFKNTAYTAGFSSALSSVRGAGLSTCRS